MQRSRTTIQGNTILLFQIETTTNQQQTNAPTNQKSRVANWCDIALFWQIVNIDPAALLPPRSGFASLIDVQLARGTLAPAPARLQSRALSVCLFVCLSFSMYSFRRICDLCSWRTTSRTNRAVVERWRANASSIGQHQRTNNNELVTILLIVFVCRLVSHLCVSSWKRRLECNTNSTPTTLFASFQSHST
jgi:hypothetical protein